MQIIFKPFFRNESLNQFEQYAFFFFAQFATMLGSRNFVIKGSTTGNGEYFGDDGQGRAKIALDFVDYEYTVENIRATAIHEVYGHGIKGWKSLWDYTGDHRKCYFAEIDSKYWKGTTLQYKQHAAYYVNYYTGYETPGKALPLKYYNATKNYFKGF